MIPIAFLGFDLNFFWELLEKIAQFIQDQLTKYGVDPMELYDKVVDAVKALGEHMDWVDEAFPGVGTGMNILLIGFSAKVVIRVCRWLLSLIPASTVGS